jgi:hypothetical protein
MTCQEAGFLESFEDADFLEKGPAAIRRFSASSNFRGRRLRGLLRSGGLRFINRLYAK